MTKRKEQINTNNDTQKLKSEQHESHTKSGINSGDPEGVSVEGNNCFIIQKLL